MTVLERPQSISDIDVQELPKARRGHHLILPQLFRTDPDRRWASAQLLVLCLVAAGALGLRLYRLDAESLWMDELVTVQTFYLPIPDVVVKAAAEGQPPLDNLIGAALARLHLADSDWWVRIPPVLFGTASVLLLGWWVGRIAGATAGIAAAVLLAVCPLHVVMSQEVRPYAILFAFTLATILAFERARTRRTRGSWVAFGAVLYLLLLTRWVAPHCIVAGLALYAVGTFIHRRRQADPAGRRQETAAFRSFATATAIAYALYTPFFILVLQSSSRAINVTAADRWDRAFGLLVEAYKAIFSGYSARTLFASLPASPWFLVVVTTLVLAGFAVLFVRMCLHRERRAALLVVVTLPFPVLYTLIYVTFTAAIPKPQYLLLTAVPLLACIAIAIDAVRRKLRPVGRTVSWTCFAILLAAITVPMTRTSLASLDAVDKRDWRGALGHVRTHSRIGDVAVSIASDVVPPTYTPLIFGRSRYGPESVRFVPIDLHTPVGVFDDLPWTAADNTVWILAYTDRMYTGLDQVIPPHEPPDGTRIHRFNGLFLIEIRGEGHALERLMHGMAQTYKDLPDGRSLIAPAVLRSRYLKARGDDLGARIGFDDAVRQCRDEAEAAILTREYLSPVQLADANRSRRDGTERSRP